MKRVGKLRCSNIILFSLDLNVAASLFRAHQLFCMFFVFLFFVNYSFEVRIKHYIYNFEEIINSDLFYLFLVSSNKIL